MCRIHTHTHNMFSKNKSIFSNAHGDCFKIDLLVNKIKYNKMTIHRKNITQHI